MKALALIFTLFFWTPSSRGAILPTRFIFGQTVVNSGSGVYQIEQEVQFQTPGEPFIIRETWWIESDQTLRLSAVGQREQKDQIKLQYIYNGGQRFFLSPQGRMSVKVGENLVEKYFHYRSVERMLSDFLNTKVLSPINLTRKQFRSVKEIEYKPEPQVRLSRVGGSLSYAFGTPSPVDGPTSPGLWIEQDSFLIRKLRLPSGAELVADRHAPAPRGLMFPKTRMLRWGGNSVTIQTLSVQSKSQAKNDFFQASSLDQQSKIEGIENPALKLVVDEFYSRFR